MFEWIKEAVYIFSYLLLLFPGSLIPIPENELDPTRPNIILAYGLGGTPSVMLPLRARLGNAGFNVVIADTGWARKDIDTLTARFDKFLTKQEERLHQKYGLRLTDLEKDLVFLGHSMGGLIILAAQARDPELMHFQVVTAGTPFRGSSLARFVFWHEAARQIRPDSKWLAKLREDIQNNPRKLLQIRAEKDEFVPTNSATLEMYPSYAAPIVGHAALIFELDPEILKDLFPHHQEKLKSAAQTLKQHAYAIKIQSP